MIKRKTYLPLAAIVALAVTVYGCSDSTEDRLRDDLDAANMAAAEAEKTAEEARRQAADAETAKQQAEQRATEAEGELDVLKTAVVERELADAAIELGCELRRAEWPTAMTSVDGGVCVAPG